jgi:hypothetical protein
MASGSSVRAKITRALAKLEASQYPWYFRTVTRTGGNSRLGLSTTVTTSDAEIDPPPAEELIAAEEIANSAGLFIAGDYRLTMSGDVAETSLKNCLLVRGSDLCKIVSYKPAGVIGAVVVAWEVIARVTKAA